MRVVSSRSALAEARSQLQGSVGLVPTMGALHAGHAALIEAARRSCDAVVVSIFVNPMQFSQATDLDRYPRPIGTDLARCAELGVDLVWNPDVDTVYPNGPAQVRVTAGALGEQLEGPNRPGHFDGVLTVVTKLLAAVRPQLAFFGEKDYQQLTLIRRLVADLDIDTRIEAVPTVRDPDGLALSSRNVFLSDLERQQALALIKALRAGQAAGTDPPVQMANRSAGVLAAAGTVLDMAEGVDVDYLELRDPDLGAAPASGPARLLVAARVGSTRLIDNMAIELV
jgi:pantoate--beta-alanine ligase